MKTYRVGIWEEQSGYVLIEAKNEKEALFRANEGLANNGVAFFRDFDCTHRDIQVVDNPKLAV